MKKCPQCNLNYPDEHLFCPQDGADLVPLAANSTSFERSSTLPTGSNKNRLIALVALLIIISVFGGGFTILENMKRKKIADDRQQYEAMVAAQHRESNERKESEEPSPQNQAAAPRTDYRFSDCTANASRSVKSIQGYNYEPSVVLDGLKETAWNVENENHGKGEWIQLAWTAERTVTRIGVIVGYDKINTRPQYRDQPNMWFRNNRLKAATLLFSTGRRIPLKFDDKTGIQYREFPPVRARWVQLIVDDVYLDMYGGTKKRWDDLTISEIQVWGKT